MNARFVRGAPAVAASLCALAGVTACNVEYGSATAGADKSASPTQAYDLKVGWSTIYLTPSWMQQTLKMLETDVDKLKSAGKVSSRGGRVGGTRGSGAGRTGRGGGGAGDGGRAAG